jgi:hypothetical protein
MKGIGIILILFFALVFTGCRERFEMNYRAAQTSYLVVEGIINTQGISKINLSRTTLLSETRTNYENGAVLEIQGEDNSRYPLSFEDSGRYVSNELMLNEEVKYRLNIKTQDSREYLSSFMSPIKTPEIDSITWTRYQDGVEIYVNSKDAINNTQYYKFDYDETWEFNAHYQPQLKTVYKRTPPGIFDVTYAYYDSVYRTAYTEIFTCWKYDTSAVILLGNTTKLGENRLYNRIVWYPKGDWRFGVLYSMNLRQQGLSKDGYEFFQKMKKNTESLGSIFDAQPSEIKGNIVCVSDTAEKVIGFIDASRVKSKRLYIKKTELPDWHVEDKCQDSIIRISPEIFYEKLYINRQMPTQEVYVDNALVGIRVADEECVDCTLRGTNVRPAFWPN